MRFVATARESGYGIVFWEDPDMSVISPGQAPTELLKKKKVYGLNPCQVPPLLVVLQDVSYTPEN